MRTARALAAAVVPLLASTALPVGGEAQSAITGIVVDARTSEPIAGATVLVRPDRRTATTEREGAFRIVVAGAVRYVVETSHIAYALRTDTIDIADGHSARLEIRLVETAIELPPIVVETRSMRLDEAGFFARRERGIGTFMTREQIADLNMRHISDVFARVPGLRRSIMPDGSSRVDSRGGRMITRRCDLQYFIDGARSEIGRAVDIDAIPLDVVEGLEVYRGGSEVPMQFDSGTAACGAVVIWTRRH